MPESKVMPVRIQRKRTKGYDMQKVSPNGLPVVYVGRPSDYGNPYKPGCSVRGETLYLTDECIIQFELDLLELGKALREEYLAPLRGKNLSCWCKIGEPCHADVLPREANR